MGLSRVPRVLLRSGREPNHPHCNRDVGHKQETCPKRCVHAKPSRLAVPWLRLRYTLQFTHCPCGHTPKIHTARRLAVASRFPPLVQSRSQHQKIEPIDAPCGYANALSAHAADLYSSHPSHSSSPSSSSFTFVRASRRWAVARQLCATGMLVAMDVALSSKAQRCARD